MVISMMVEELVDLECEFCIEIEVQKPWRSEILGRHPHAFMCHAKSMNETEPVALFSYVVFLTTANERRGTTAA